MSDWVPFLTEDDHKVLFPTVWFLLCLCCLCSLPRLHWPVSHRMLAASRQETPKPTSASWFGSLALRSPSTAASSHPARKGRAVAEAGDLPFTGAKVRPELVHKTVPSSNAIIRCPDPSKSEEHG